jgi:hypothetical protein
MVEREIKTALGTYVNEAGVSTYGFKGDTVKVHKDHVERFDEFNVDGGEEFAPERHPVETVAPGTVADDPDTLPEYETEPQKKAPAKKAT